MYSQTVNGWTFFTGADYGLPDNRFLRVFEDSKGNLWFGTYNGVVKDDGFSKTIYNNGNSGLPSNTVGKIAEDSKGNMWFGSNGGVTKFDGAIWTTLTTVNSSLPSNEVTRVSIDYKDRVWVTTISGVLVIDGNKQTVYNSSNSSIPVGPALKDLVTRATFDSKKNTWLSTQAGVVKITDAGVWSVLNSKNSGLTCDTVGPILEDKDGNYWFGTQKGIAKFDGTNWMFYNKSNSPLPANYIWEMIQDSYGSIWISVYSNTYPYPPPLTRLSNGVWTTFSNGCFSFGMSTVTMTEDSHRKIWFAVSNGLAKFDPEQGTVVSAPSELKDLINIFPNPTTGKVRIQSTYEKPVRWIAVTDMQGRQLLRTENPENNEVDISTLSKGIYCLSLGLEKSVCVKKIIKK
jgi:ligand-binding sensor domain-containing protein